MWVFDILVIKLFFFEKQIEIYFEKFYYKNLVNFYFLNLEIIKGFIKFFSELFLF